MEYEYWRRQTNRSLFSDIDWNRPEQKSQAGRLAIIGGNKLSFASVACGCKYATEFGVGEVRAMVPDALQRLIPNNKNTFFAQSNDSGGFSKKSVANLTSITEWADAVVLIGDLGKNSETAIAMEHLMKASGKLLITRDSIDLLMNNMGTLVEREETMIFASMAQLQKIFRTVYYPKVLTFNMQLNTLVEAVHKFTVTYPLTVATLHQDVFVAAYRGEVITTELRLTKYSPILIWNGEAAVKAASHFIWNPESPLEAAAVSIMN